MSLYPKCSRKNRKCLKPGSKCGEGIQILLSLSPNSLISKGLVSSHFGQPWNNIFSLVGNLSSLAVRISRGSADGLCFPFGHIVLGRDGDVPQNTSLLAAPFRMDKGKGFGVQQTPFPHCSILGAQLVVTLGLDFHPQPTIEPLSALKKKKTTKAFVMHKAKEIMGKSASKLTFFTDQEFHDLVESTNNTGTEIHNIWWLVCVATAANISNKYFHD